VSIPAPQIFAVMKGDEFSVRGFLGLKSAALAFGTKAHVLGYVLDKPNRSAYGFIWRTARRHKQIARSKCWQNLSQHRRRRAA
jgi:hypothetical protein